MHPIAFPEMNKTWAKNQPPYLPLPAYVDEQQSISCWRLTWRERFTLLLTGRLWLRQLNFCQPLQPQVERPRFNLLGEYLPARNEWSTEN